MGDFAADGEGRVGPAPSAWRGVVTAFLKYLAARGELAQIEAQEAVEHLVRVAVLGVTALTLAAGAWMLTVPAAVWMVCQWRGWPLDMTLIVTGGLHVVLALFLVRVMRRRLKQTRWFAETLEQFKKDQTWIKRETEQR